MNRSGVQELSVRPLEFARLGKLGTATEIDSEQVSRFVANLQFGRRGPLGFEPLEGPFEAFHGRLREQRFEGLSLYCLTVVSQTIEPGVVDGEQFPRLVQGLIGKWRVFAEHLLGLVVGAVCLVFVSPGFHYRRFAASAVKITHAGKLVRSGSTRRKLKLTVCQVGDNRKGRGVPHHPHSVPKTAVP